MSFDEQVAARTLWQEVRGEERLGQIAVAHVLWNRKGTGRWGKTLASVCLWRSQFSAWGPVDPGNKNMVSNFLNSCELDDEAGDLTALLGVLHQAEGEDDPTLGAIYYHAEGVTPTWAPTKKFLIQIGRHLFYKDPSK